MLSVGLGYHTDMCLCSDLRALPRAPPPDYYDHYGNDNDDNDEDNDGDDDNDECGLGASYVHVSMFKVVKLYVTCRHAYKSVYTY